MQTTTHASAKKLALVALIATSIAGLTCPDVKASALSDKADAFVSQATDSNDAAVIVRIDGPLTSARAAKLRSLGCDVYRNLPIIHSVALRLPARNLARLAALEFVLRLSSDLDARKCDAFTTVNSKALAAYTQNGLTGSGVTVAVLDSGIHPSSDLTSSCLPSLNGLGVSPLTGPSPLSASRVLANVNFVPNQPASQSTVIALAIGNANLAATLTNPGNPADDTCGHGTHVSGIIAGNGASSSGLTTYRTFYGIARNANLVNVRVLDGNGVSTVSTVIAGIQWIIANQAKYKIRVLNCSLGHPVGESYATDPLCQAMEQAWKAGIVVVCAAGNAGRQSNTVTQGASNEGYGANYGSIISPGNDPYVITVGATKQMDSIRADDKIATYSSRGPSLLDLVLKPDIIAPGNKIISVEAKGSSLQQNCGATNEVTYGQYESLTLAPSSSSNNYFILSGTSMAAPVVSGAAALMLQANPALTPDTIKARLMLTADKWLAADGTSDPLTYGAGYMDVPAALASTIMPTQPALSPMLTANADGTLTLKYDGTVWSTNAIWGTSVTDANTIYGSHAIWGTGAVASSSAVWGKDCSADHAVWGNDCSSDHAVWGNSATAVDLSSIAVNGE